MSTSSSRPLALVTGASTGIGLELAKHVVRDMAARGEGRILFTSSIASTMPGSFQAVYNASKRRA